MYICLGKRTYVCILFFNFEANAFISDHKLLKQCILSRFSQKRCCFPKKLTTWRDSNPGLLFFRLMRWLLRHVARAPNVFFYNMYLCTYIGTGTNMGGMVKNELALQIKKHPLVDIIKCRYVYEQSYLCRLFNFFPL
jgi:hypothetical protein